MHQQHGRMLASKWLKTTALMTNGYVARHIPPTRIYSTGNLKTMLHRFGMVVLKPVRGAGGNGVIKATRVGRGYQLHSRSSVRYFGTFAGLCGQIGRLKGRRAYLIQRGIRLATIAGRPIDYRVKHVKTDAGWQIRAMVGRVARRGAVRHQPVQRRHPDHGRPRHRQIAVGAARRRQEESNAPFDAYVDGAAGEPLPGHRTAWLRLRHRSRRPDLDAGSEYASAVTSANGRNGICYHRRLSAQISR
ncbi:YheC/YheD family protein [Cohnella rhizosphaerae]